MRSVPDVPEPTANRAAGSRKRTIAEIAIVLGLTLGQSAVYSIVQFLDKVTRAPLGSQTTTMNPDLSPRPYFDLTYQLLEIVFALVPVALVFFLLTEPGKSAFRKLGFTLARPGRDFLTGLGLAALIGIPSLGLYAAGRALGITTAIVPSALDALWWTIPVLMLSAIRHAVVEEVIMIGYLFNRLTRLGVSIPAMIVASALVRGSYHLYQGIGPFIGNVVMGLVFGWVYTRVRRVLPLVVGHALIDIVAFVGFSLFGTAIGLG